MIALRDVRAGYTTPGGFVAALDGVSLTVQDDEILGIAGESGCGKSTLVRVLYGEVDGALRVVGGEVAARFADHATGVTTLVDGASLHRYWWDLLSYVPQGSMSVLNPLARIGAQFADALPARRRAGGAAALRRDIAGFLTEFDLAPDVLDRFPHQLSGGMRQRVLVAMAAFVEPRMILADEPTTALDVVVQKRILLLLHQVQRRQRNSLVIVSHDLGVHYQVADRVAIVYAGRIVEIGPTEAIFARPLHPYTAALIAAIPRIGDDAPRQGIEGRPPDLAAPPPGCRFSPRCPEAEAACFAVAPPLRAHGTGREVACLRR